MKKLLLITLIILVITSLACITTQQTPELITKINQVRQDNNLKPLNYTTRLDDFAQYRFNQVDPNNLSHKNLRHDYAKFMGRYLENGAVATCGEIILKSYAPCKNFDYYDIDDYINFWLNSPTHRAVILNETFENIGCYIGYKDVFTIIIVVEFDTLY